MSIFSAEVEEASKKLNSDWLDKAVFDGEGVVLQIKSVEKVASRFGALETDFLVRQGILEEGETFRYTFADVHGNEKKLDSKSTPFFIAIKSVEELTNGEWLHITRTGKTTETRFTAVRADAPKDVPQDAVDPTTGIPF